MGLFFGSRQQRASLADYGVRPRSDGRSADAETRRDSLKVSVKWACLRLRADLLSTTPLDVFRRVAGVQVEVPKTPVFLAPGGSEADGVGMVEWLYSSQFDLDDCGNHFGIIRARDGMKLPSLIEQVPVDTVTVRVRKGKRTYRIDGTEYQPDEVWHERQFTTSGSPVGLSPTAHSALSAKGYLSAQEFAVSWFDGGGVPAAHLQNVAKQTLTPEESATAKARFKASVSNGDLLVSGKDWEYHMLGAKASESAFIEQMTASAPDQCRFYGVPGDMVDVQVPTGTVTYANVTQRNLQLLVLNMGPAYLRREDMLSRRLLPQPRYAKFNTDALLRLDPETRSNKLIAEVQGRLLAPSEARELMNMQPFTDEQLAEFDRLFGARTKTPSKEV